MKYLSIFLFIATATAQQTALNPAQFLVQVVRQTGTENNIENSLLSTGVLIQNNFAVTVANVLHNVPLAELRVFMQSTRRLNSTDIRTVTRVLPYNSFNITNFRANNIALLELQARDGDNIRVEPRNLGSLSAAECRVFIFAPGVEEVITRTVPVNTAGCRENQPFCATDTMPAQVTGRPDIIGSPVICQAQDQVAGFANDEMDCQLGHEIRCTMTFLNMEPYHGWIRYVTTDGAESTGKVSIILLLLGVAIGKLLM